MFTLKQVLILALAGVSVALPHDMAGGFPGRWRGNRDKWIQTGDSSSDNTVVVTVYPDGGNSGSDDGDNSDDGSSVPVANAAPAAAPAADASAGSQTGYMAVVAKYRAAGGLPALTEDSKLQSNAQNTANAQKGDGSMKHILNSGSMAQVLAPGSASDFEHVYLGGWLCEMPGLKGLSGLCSAASKGWNHAGQTGHAEILTDPKYKKIGCALGQGIWACDLA